MTDRLSSRFHTGLAALLVTCIATCSLSRPAMAGPPDAEARSRALYGQAETLANNANWVEACPLFQAAHDLHGTGGTAIRTADCYEKIGKYDRALSLYQWIVDHRDSDKQPDRVALAEQRVAALKKQLGLDQGAPIPPPPGPPGPPPGPPGPPGPPLPPVVGPIARTTDSTPDVVVSRPNRVPGIVLVSIGAAGFIVMGVAGGLALSEASDLKSICSPNVPCPKGASDKSGADTKATVSNVGLGIGIAGVVIGGILLIAKVPKVDAVVKTSFDAHGLTLRF